MSIFSQIRDAIFHRTSTSSTPSETVSRADHPPSASSNNIPGIAQSSAAATTTKPQPVDVEALLEERAAKNPQKLNWRTSIIDLMKLLDLDPTLENRKELAAELGYTGNTADSASMNIWLHKQVLVKLAANSGTVPDSLKH